MGSQVSTSSDTHARMDTPSAVLGSLSQDRLAVGLPAVPAQPSMVSDVLMPAFTGSPERESTGMFRWLNLLLLF